jgi:hypothetical protein
MSLFTTWAFFSDLTFDERAEMAADGPTEDDDGRYTFRAPIIALDITTNSHHQQ